MPVPPEERPAEKRRSGARLLNELTLLHEIGLRAAEAGEPRRLFGRIVDLLARQGGFVAIVAAYEWDRQPVVRRYLRHAVDEASLERLTRRATRMLAWSESATPVTTTHELEGFRPSGRGEAFDDKHAAVLPLISRRRTLGCLAVASAPAADESRTRIWYASANQLALHLERLTALRDVAADRYRALVDSMPQGVLWTDAGLRVVHANDVARRLLSDAGVGDDGALDGALRGLGLGEAIDAVLSGERQVGERELAPSGRAGRRTWSVTVSPLLEAGGPVDGLVFVLADITERRRFERALAQTEKLSGLGQMIAGVAHELNNPLASIVGYAQLLRASQPSERREEWVERLAREGARCKRIVRNLLSFAGQSGPGRSRLALNDVVSGVRPLFEYQLRVEDIALELRLADDLPVIEGDPHELEQVLVNLVNNARQSIRRTARPGTIRIVTAAEPGAVVVDVEDDGPGVPSEHKERIFDPFFTTKQPEEGTGLGLSLVCRVVEAHGGTLELMDGAGGRGARFRLRLRTQRDDAASGRATTTGPGEPPVVVAPGRVLVVDDEPSVATMICAVLRKDGHVADRAGDAAAALERLRHDRYDMVISDLRMPAMDGLRFHEALRRDHPALAGRLLLVSGDTFGGAVDAVARETGLDPLRKPFDIDELRRRVRGCLAGRGR